MLPISHRRTWLPALPALLLSGRVGLAQEAAGVSRDPGVSVNSGTRAESPLVLTWVSSDPSCNGASVGTRALQLVRQGVTPRPTEAHAQVAREGSQWLVELQTRSESRLGRRTLRGESCEEIQQAIALLLAMILESEAKEEAALPPAAAALAPTLGGSLDSGRPELDEAPAHPAPPPPPRQSLFGALLRLDGIAAWGLQPSLGLGASGSVGVALGPFELLATGAYWPASRAAIFDRDGLIEVTRKVLGVTACYELWDTGRMSVVPCVSPELMWLDWRSLRLSSGPDHGQLDHMKSLTAFAELRFQLIGPMFISMTPGLTWEQSQPFHAHQCQNCAGTDVFHTWSIAPRFGAGVGARF
jgi:hypothetical protein